MTIRWQSSCCCCVYHKEYHVHSVTTPWCSYACLTKSWKYTLNPHSHPASLALLFCFKLSIKNLAKSINLFIYLSVTVCLSIWILCIYSWFAKLLSKCILKKHYCRAWIWRNDNVFRKWMFCSLFLLPLCLICNQVIAPQV